jgi:para-nitrobenzyl esterase
MMICTTFHEWSMTRTNPELEQITKEAVIEMLSKGGMRGGNLGDKAGAVVEAYQKVFPNAKPAELLALISSNRKGVIATADAKATQKAPVYLAWFGWEPPMFNGRMRAFHCLDICFWFANTDLMLTHTGGGARPRQLSEKMSGTLLQFMRTGDPNGGGLPQWNPYTTEVGETMVLNDSCELKNDPDRDARLLL